MFDFLSMMDNYDDRKVDYFEDCDLQVSTASVTDGAHPYETAVAHLEYNSGKYVIVEAYGDAEQAQTGHDRWVKLMTSDDLPDRLTDCANSGVSQFGQAIGVQMEFSRQK